MAGRRPSGDGNIRQKRKNLWEGRIVVGHKNDGTPIFRYVYGKTQKEALDKMHQRMEEYRGVELTEESNMTLGDWLDKWMNEYMIFSIRPSTFDSYTNMIENHIKPHLGDKQIAFITTAEVQKMYNHLKKYGRKRANGKDGTELADSMIRGIHMMLHEAMNAAVKERLIVKNPTNGTTIPKNNYPPMQILNEEQFKIFLEAIKCYPEWYDFFYTECTTGLRLGEICGLRWEDFDEESGKLKISRSVTAKRGGGLAWGETKTETGKRTILLPPSTASILRRRKETAIGDWIFQNLYKPELPMAPSSAYNKLKVILKNAELPLIRFHDLRHTFATKSLENGMDVKTLSAIIGHVSAATTLDIYSHMTDTMQMQASINIDRKIGGTDAEMPIAKETPKPNIKTQPAPDFKPLERKIRKSGTGCVYQINDTLWEGSYYPRLPNGKRKKFNVYAKTREECEKLLAEMIEEKKAEIAQEKERLKAKKTEQEA